MTPQQLKSRLPSAAFAFRGYNVTNLGRSPELLAHRAYGRIVQDALREASRVCSDVLGRRVNLVTRVRNRRETTLRTYGEALALIMAVEQAQLRLLDEFFGIQIRSAKLSYGYSLGEICAVAASGVVESVDAMRVLLTLTDDCIALAKDVTLGVLFSRGEALPLDAVRWLCLEINQEGRGVIGISAHLSPNSLLLLGQGDTLERFKIRLEDTVAQRVHLRIRNKGEFPPLHTPITWERNIPNRAAVLMHTMPGGFTMPQPPVLSLVTGQTSYNEYNAREILHRWTDHPQLLWDAVYGTLTGDIELIVHVGPDPNIIPATYNRLRDNVEAETRGRIGMRALTAVVHHPWIKPLLRRRTALLRAPLIKHIVLEDWLLAQPVS